MDLASKKCVACEGGMPPLGEGAVRTLISQLDHWSAGGTKKLSKEFLFKDFNKTMAFVNKIAEIAEQEGHHPDLHIFYNKLTIELTTHAIGGLSENDFIVAAKIDKLEK